MSDSILVIVEQRESKLNRISWETITAGQAIAAATGWTLEAAVVGASAASIAAEIATKKVAKVYAIESAKLEPYTPDAFAAALKQFLTANQSKLVLMPHTIKCATSSETRYRHGPHGHQRLHWLQTRRRQACIHAANVSGKLTADVSFTSDAPWFATFQNGAFRGR